MTSGGSPPENRLKDLLYSIMTKKGEFSAKSRGTLFAL